MNTHNFDLAIIGAGPGGYVAAIRASQLGLKVCLIEKNKSLGGTCMNVGCIPTKTLLDSSKHFYNAKKTFSTHGIVVENLKVNLEKMLSRKNKVVETLTKGIDFLIKSNNIKRFNGEGTLISKHEIRISNPDETHDIGAKKIILATGSEPNSLPNLQFDGKMVVNSTDALNFHEIPKNLVIIGSGAIGLELGNIWSNLGSNVTIIEIMPQILPGLDKDIAGALERSLKKQGINFHLETMAHSLENKLDKKLKIINSKGTESFLSADKILVAVGRKPYFENLGLENLGIEINHKSKQITVNETFQTNIDNIYAIGDLIHGPMLAHKAEEEGIIAAEHIASGKTSSKDILIPNVVYTSPEVACVGEIENSLKIKNQDYSVGSFFFRANGRAICMNQIDGVVKILSDKKTGKCLGAQIVGPFASELIAEITTVMNFGGNIKNIINTVHAHPTLSESIKEAALDSEGRAINAISN